MTNTLPDPTFTRLSRLLPTCMLACVLAGACGIAAAAPDDDKLRLLSCDMPGAAGRKAAVDWFNATAQTLERDAGHRIAGPIRLGKACLQDVTLAGGFGVVMVQGDICNTRLEDFTDALAAAGTALGTEGEAGRPEVVLGMRGANRSYQVTRGRMDPRSGKIQPGPTPYAFTCMAAEGGPQ